MNKYQKQFIRDLLNLLGLILTVTLSSIYIAPVISNGAEDFRSILPGTISGFLYIIINIYILLGKD